MRWHVRGVVVPGPPPVSWAASHANMAIAQPLPDGRLRVWFTSRDAQGRSHVGRVELDLDDPASAVYDPNPVLSPGPLGRFDDSGAMSSSLVEHDGRLYLYYVGWNRLVTVPFATFVGCAVSEDGTTFERASPAPVVERGPHDPYLTTTPWVLVEDGRWRMWYVSGTGWPLVDGRPRHSYRIVYAESEDGLRWERDGRVCIDYGPGEYALARPCVVRDGDRYRMWFCARGEAYRLGYAESVDGLEWERDDSRAGLAASGRGWDDEMQCYPCVFDHEGARHLLYSGNGYGVTGIGHAVLGP